MLHSFLKEQWNFHLQRNSIVQEIIANLNSREPFSTPSSLDSASARRQALRRQARSGGGKLYVCKLSGGKRGGGESGGGKRGGGGDERGGGLSRTKLRKQMPLHCQVVDDYACAQLPRNFRFFLNVHLCSRQELLPSARMVNLTRGGGFPRRRQERRR
jgi:hypothetical protein